MFGKASDTTVLAQRGYKVNNVLGQGSYATVKGATFKKNDKDSPIHVAIKIISLDEIPADFKNKFLRREIEIIKVLEHPNIIKAIEVIQSKKKIYIPIELASRGDLLSYIQLRGPLPDDILKKFFLEMCLGIDYLHKHGVVHRDIKCDNILLDSTNRIKLTDFGFARKMTKSDLSKTFCGSAAYAAPEVLQGIPYKGTVADIWSLGVVLFTMACALMPYRDTSVKILLSDQKAGVRYPSKLAGKVSDDLKSLLDSILCCNTNLRITLSCILSHQWLADVER